MEFTAETLAGFLGGTVEGDPAAKVWTIAKIEEAGTGALCFLSNPKYEPFIYTTGATAVIVNKDFAPSQPVKATMIRVDDAYGAFAKLLELYVAGKPRKTGVSPLASIDEGATLGEGCYVGQFAVISPGAKVGKNCRIYPGVYLGDNVRVGDNALLMPGVVIYEECVLGNNVTIHAGSVIGADGFGFAPNAAGSYDKIPQVGNVVIEDDVEIGANTCVDRATMGSTVVKKGVKLDNLVQIAHNVVVGENTVLAAQVGVAGSSKIGKNCMAGGQVGISGHLTVGDGVQLGSKSGVSNNIPAGEVHLGYPSMPGRQFHRSFAVYRNLPDLSIKVSKLEKELTALKKPMAQDEK
ncbi:MAG: UDP-3-O-(3-hydroxymyristoyl)glucosamine N-acyltransferase [Rikenellaceae bacterium]|jgi:UDP-3-O-[3-hydroxymyristoyl] glucosamine N-acyltransferase|nr:UDP-3-O-(3-hydroxymyristoyl)glucosamine N-acyltransferase [Rikenellaceae bacterium]